MKQNYQNLIEKTLIANDLEIIMTYEADNIEQLESCIKAMMKKAQFYLRKPYGFLN